MSEQATATTSQPVSVHAVLYLRVAFSARQSDMALAAQREACERKAAALGAHVTEVYVDTGVSGAALQRPGFEQMMSRIREQRDVDYIITHDLGRISLNSTDSFKVYQGLRELGVDLVPVIPDLEDGDHRGLVTGIVKLVDQFYALYGVPAAEQSFRVGEAERESHSRTLVHNATRNEGAR